MKFKLSDDYLLNPKFMDELKTFVNLIGPMEGYYSPEFKIVRYPNTYIYQIQKSTKNQIEKQNGRKLRYYAIIATWISKDYTKKCQCVAELLTMPNCDPLEKIKISDLFIKSLIRSDTNE